MDVKKAVATHEKACLAMEKAQDKEAIAYQKLLEALEAEQKEKLLIYRPCGCLR